MADPSVFFSRSLSYLLINSKMFLTHRMLIRGRAGALFWRWRECVALLTGWRFGDEQWWEGIVKPPCFKSVFTFNRLAKCRISKRKKNEFSKWTQCRDDVVIAGDAQHAAFIILGLAGRHLRVFESAAVMIVQPSPCSEAKSQFTPLPLGVGRCVRAN